MNFLEIYQKYLQVKKIGKNYFSLCPFHSESNPSFSINPETGWFHCFGCHEKGNIFRFLQKMKEQGRIDEEDEKLIQRKPEKIQELKNKAQHNTELGKNYRKIQQKTFDEKKSELLKDGYSFISEYIYYSLNGIEKYRTYRFEKPKGDGTFAKEIFPTVDGIVGMQGKKQIPYGLHQFMFASPDAQIWITEGEKCADAIISVMPSNANVIVLGYRKPSDFLNIPIEELFPQKKIVLFEDNDETGSKNTKEIVEILKPFAKEIRVVKFTDFPEKYDVADYLAEKDWNSLLKLIEIAEMIETPASQLSVIKTGTMEKIEKQEEWIMEPFLPMNSIIMLDGLGGTGKSIFAMEMAYAISTGQSFLFQDIAPTGKYPIIYITAEETDWRFWERLKSIENAYQSQSKNFYWLSTIAKDFYLPTSRLFAKKQNEIQPTDTFLFLIDAIQKTNAKLVVLDSWINFYGLDENSTEDGICAYDYLKTLIKQLDCSFLLIHHQTKEAMRGQVNIFRGTMVFREQARTRIAICKKHGQRIVEIEKSNYYSELLEVFPISIELSNGVWTVTGQKVVVEEEEIGRKDNRKGNGKKNRSEVIYQDPNYPDSDFA